MKKLHISRNRLLASAALIFLFVPAAVPAHAVSKEIVELQTQVQQLLDMVQRLQSTMDSRFGVMQHLAEQTADAANQVTTTVNTLQQKLNSQNEAVSGKVDAVSGQMQSLNDSVDELKARIAKLDKSVQDLQAQLQTLQTQQAQGAQGATPGGAAMPAIRTRTGTGARSGKQSDRWSGARRSRRAASATVAGDAAGRPARLRCGTLPGCGGRVPGCRSLLSA